MVPTRELKYNREPLINLRFAVTEDALGIESIPAALFEADNFPLLAGILRGVEKESLRVSATGQLSLTDHPSSLGSALTHPRITTDFSEALLEFITPPSHLISQLTEQLRQLHAFTYQNLGDEALWVNSMPCAPDAAHEIPVARYGSSHRGRMKTVYRLGLGHRYGRVMQTVAGLHYNFSLPRAFWAFLHQHERATSDLADYIDTRYFDLIRNFRRNYWLLMYLFGASPALCSSFVSGRDHDLTPFNGDVHTLHAPYATCLRMGDLGYQSSAQESLYVCYNGRSSYVETLARAIFSPYQAYQAIGAFDASGNRQQLNTGLLQIENEFYSSIRPKRTAEAGETALTALSRRGVEYIEVRCLDLDPFAPVGLTEQQVRFLDVFLLYCLFKDSPRCDIAEFRRIARNHKRVVKEGRRPGLALETPAGGELPLAGWGAQLLAAMQPVAELLDGVHGGTGQYRQALLAQQAKISQPERTPSAQVLALLKSCGLSFASWGQTQARALKEQFKGAQLSGAQLHQLRQLAANSVLQQQEEERQNKGDFEQYLSDYYRQYRECCTSLDQAGAAGDCF